MTRPRGFDTLSVKGCGHGHPADAVNVPVFMTASFGFGSAEAAASTFAGEVDRFVYSRVANPTQAELEQRLALLENAQSAMACASGMGAIASVLWSFLRAGDRVVAHCRMYGNTFNLLTKGLPDFGIQVDLVDLTAPGALEHALAAPAAMVFFETPSNPLLEIIDIARTAELAHAAGAICVVDGTLAPPPLQRPLELGADLVIHSLTKYLSGHGDVLGGMVAGTAEAIKAIRMRGLRFMTGASLSPHSAFLILRGLKTLGLRMERHCKSARTIAEALLGHPKIESVLYPGLPSCAGYNLAGRQMTASGGMIGLELKGGSDAGRKFMNALKLAVRAVSLGDAETLVQHPASMTHASYTGADRQAFGIGDGLVRISIGLEDMQDILKDLTQALDCA